MRVGNNPNKDALAHCYGKVIASVVTYLPVAGGYHKDRLKVVKCSLETMKRNAGVDCEILVWDNGSYPSFTQWLKYEYQPDYLILSPNVGKINARTAIIKMLPPETILAAADDDMFYYPDWLKTQIEILKYFPNVGTVSGWPVRTQFRFANRSTIAWGTKNNCLKYGRWISEQEDKDFCSSIGREYSFQVQTTANEKEAILAWKGKTAYATGHHCQFVAYAGRLAPLVGYSDKAMPEERSFEYAVDRAGLLRLTTFHRNTRHIGNVLDKDLEDLWKKA